MKLSLKLSLIMGVLALTIAGSNIFSIYQLNRVNMTSTELADKWMPAIVAIEEVNTLFSDFRIAEMQHAIATDDRVMREYEQEMANLRREFDKRLKVYEAIPMSEEGKRVYNEFKRTQDEYSKIHDTVIALSRQHKMDETMALLNGKCRDIYLQSTKVLMQLVERNLRGGRAASEAGDAMYKTASFSLSTILVVSLILSAGLTVMVVRGTQQQLGKDPGELAAIATRVTKGDYDIDDGAPHIGVYGNIVAMVGALKENIFKAREESQRAQEQSEKAREALASAEAASAEARRKSEAMLKAADRLEQVATIVSSASTQLSAQIEESERGAAQQAARVAETATAMEEMNSTVLEVARNAGAASEVSSSTREKAESGARIVSEAVESILRVQQASAHLRGEMVTLDDNAKAISRIMDVISDIADQTNLLALNAAIEAARAGEAGRGFAVVADEVRKLAEKTMASTTDVGNAIRAIQQSASQNMVDMDNSVKIVEQATTLANQSGDALREIVAMIDNTADQVRAIATASEQQSASSDEINQSIVQVNTIASETARAMGEAAHAVSDLAAQAQVLTTLIEDMKRG